MKTTMLTATAARQRVRPPGFLSRLARRAVLTTMASLRDGEVILHEGGRVHTFGKPTDRCPVSVELQVLDNSFFADVAFGGSVGAGDSYTAGRWTSSDLTGLIRVFCANREVLNGVDSGLARLTAPLLKLVHSFRGNSRNGSRRNIAAHYDLGNDFYRLFLDDTLTYSAGIFEDETSTLEDASRAKLDRLCRKLRLTPEDHVLEIGTGWGSFALHAAQNYGCRVTTTTISREQYELACERVAAAGLGDRISVLFEDYRDVRGQFTRIASIEMIEAVGWQYYDEFFRVCADRLVPDGLAAIQAITIQDQEYERAKRSVDFIQARIFPGSCIPSIAALSQSIARATDLKLVHLEDFTPHYARTLREWRERFFANLDQVRALGYSEEFIRMWEYYLCYCEGGFHERAIGCVQMVLTKPDCRTAPLLGVLP